MLPYTFCRLFRHSRIYKQYKRGEEKNITLFYRLSSLYTSWTFNKNHISVSGSFEFYISRVRFRFISRLQIFPLSSLFFCIDETIRQTLTAKFFLTSHVGREGRGMGERGCWRKKNFFLFFIYYFTEFWHLCFFSRPDIVSWYSCH